MPALVIVGGPNGSGKTTLTAHLIKRGRIKTAVINPDEIALNEYGSYTFHVKAAKSALERRSTALSSNADFAFETTFSGNSEINTVLTARENGYEVTMYYVALQSVIDNIVRVEEREHNMGHSVELSDQLRRYDKSKANLIKNIALFHRVYLFDNSGTKRSRVAIFDAGNLLWLNPKHKSHPFYKDLFRADNTENEAEH
jgi:predicted ABC-type ATPase